MIDICLLIAVTSLLVWAVVDIYFYSIVFEPIRRYADGYQTAGSWLTKHFRYMLGCPFCFSHWAAAAVMFIVWLFSKVGVLPMDIHFLAAVLLIPVSARIGTYIRENTLPPMVFHDSSETGTDNSDSENRE